MVPMCPPGSEDVGPRPPQEFAGIVMTVVNCRVDFAEHRRIAVMQVQGSDLDEPTRTMAVAKPWRN